MTKPPPSLNQITSLLQKGGVIIFPTDTVWGLGVSLKSSTAIKKLYHLKHREEGKPTAVLVGNQVQAETLAQFSNKARQLAQKYWPGALTLIVRAKPNLPLSILGQVGTIGLRVPQSHLVRDICQVLGTGLVATSANLSGDHAPIRKSDINPQLIKLADAVVGDDINIRSGQASTVVDTTTKPLTVIRQGPININEN